MPGVKARLSRHLAVSTVEAPVASEHEGVEINIMGSFSPCTSPAQSPTQEDVVNVNFTPIATTQEKESGVSMSVDSTEVQATRQSPSESPIEDEREALSHERQSPSLASDSSSNTLCDDDVENDECEGSRSRGTESLGRPSLLASESSSSSTTAPDDVTSKSTIGANDKEETAPMYRKTPSLVSDTSLSSSVSGDILSTVTTRIDRYSPQVIKTDARHSGELQQHEISRLDRIEAAWSKSGTIEDKADDILTEARSFVTLNTPVYSPTTDKRAEEILQEARSHAGHTTDAGRRRTTEEVLQMAGEVLSSRSKSPGISPQQSRDHSYSIKSQKKAHACLYPPSIETRKPSWEADIDLPKSVSSMSDEEIAYKMNMIRSLPLQQVLSDDSILVNPTREKSEPLRVQRIKATPRKTSEVHTFSLLGFLDKKVNASPASRRSRNGFSPFGCSSRAVDNVVSTDEDETPAVQLNSMLHSRISALNPFNCRDSGLLSVDEDDGSAPLSVAPPHPIPGPDLSRPSLSQSEALSEYEADSRMPIWMTEHGAEVIEGPDPEDTFYSIAASRAIVVHEIVRGNWTWCTAWSPDGGRLALGTENHHLAVVDTTASTVWRVRHDQRITEPPKNGTTHSIRSIAWGQDFIAIGGTGNAVSILAPIEPYPVLHTILDTGFVGSLCWRKNSTVLAIGSREDKCLVLNVSAAANGDGDRHIQSTVLETITRVDWVNAVAFSPGGTALAIGDRSGTLSVYSYERKMPHDPPTISFQREFILDDSVLAVEWSADGRWLYAGGEEFVVNVIDTTTWTVVHVVERKKWVQFISSSKRGTHVAVGGFASEVSILDVQNSWEKAIDIELKGMVPLSAEWHPQDQYLALTGQNNSVVAVETTNARHVQGHCLQSISPVLEVEFSPDGQMVVIGNQAGVVSFFSLEGSVFVTIYEMVLTSGESQSIRWSRDGQYVVIGTGDQVIVVSKISDDKMKRMPPGASGFSVRKVIRGLGKVRSISIDDTSRYVAVGGTTTQILHAADQFACLREWKKRIVQCNAFSPDGTWLASIGRNENLTIYNTTNARVDQWRVVFTLKAERAGLALAWGPLAVNGLQYLAYGGANNVITIIEIRTKEETWETVLQIPRACVIHDLDWNNTGMLAAAIGDGTVTVVDLEYLQSGWAMNEMDYTWQRQGITCLTEIRRNKGKNSMRTVRWIPSIDQSLIAIGGTDGSLEIVDLTERKRCRGFLRASSKRGNMVVN